MHLRMFLVITCIAWSILLATPAMPLSADHLLDQVILGFPDSPVSVSGTLIVRQRRGVPVATYAFDMSAAWQARSPYITYTIRDSKGTPLSSMHFSPGSQPPFQYRSGPELQPAPTPDLAANIAKSDISWSDLTFDFLWWRGARFQGEAQVRGFDCHLIHVDRPPGVASEYAAVRLWISKESHLLLQAEGLDVDGKPIRRLWVQSVRRIGEQWMLNTLEVQQTGLNSRTRLQVDTISLDED